MSKPVHPSVEQIPEDLSLWLDHYCGNGYSKQNRLAYRKLGYQSHGLLFWFPKINAYAVATMHQSSYRESGWSIESIHQYRECEYSLARFLSQEPQPVLEADSGIEDWALRLHAEEADDELPQHASLNILPTDLKRTLEADLHKDYLKGLSAARVLNENTVVVFYQDLEEGYLYQRHFSNYLRTEDGWEAYDENSVPGMSLREFLSLPVRAVLRKLDNED